MERICCGVSVVSCLIWNIAVVSGAVLENPSLQPYFVSTNQLMVNATSGKTAYLRCRVRHLGPNIVVWLRERDLHILTYDVYTFTSEDQFEPFHAADSDEWTLMIRHTQVKDSGTYACQVSSEPYISQYYHLNIFEPRTKITGSPEQYFQTGSDINLTCVVMETLEPMEEIFWFNGEDIINNAIHEGINIVTDREIGTSQLTISGVQTHDSGNYSCSLSNSDFASVTVFVLDEPNQNNGVS
jgi:hypothetical protein